MNTLAFTLGVLSVIIAAFVVVLVWGIVKVVKQGKQIEANQKWFESSIDNVWRSKEEERRNNYEREQHYSRDLDRRFEDLERSVNSQFQTVSTNIQSSAEDLHRRIDETYRTMDEQKTELSTQSKSYTDSRIDKLIDAYFEYGELNKKKQVIKG